MHSNDPQRPVPVTLLLDRCGRPAAAVVALSPATSASVLGGNMQWQWPLFPRRRVSQTRVERSQRMLPCLGRYSPRLMWRQMVAPSNEDVLPSGGKGRSESCFASGHIPRDGCGDNSRSPLSEDVLRSREYAIDAGSRRAILGDTSDYSMAAGTLRPSCGSLRVSFDGSGRASL